MTKEQGTSRFWELAEQAKLLQEEIRLLLPSLAEARRKYSRSKSDVDRIELERIQNFAGELLATNNAVGRELEQASGLSEEILRAIETQNLPGDGENRLLRGDLIEQRVAVTGIVETHLAEAIDAVTRLVPSGWLQHDSEISHRIDRLIDGSDCLSLVKGLRSDSEFPHLHRLRQMIRVSKDYQDEELAYDHFAGATVVPQLVQLGTRLKNLNDVGGDVSLRVRRLWEGATESTDANVFELLVAAGCAEYGRKVEFLPETHERSPDIRCHDPYPMVIECKRKRVLSNYEIDEEASMRRLFSQLEIESNKRGLYGRFDLHLKVESNAIPSNDIVAGLISQRLAPHPDRPLDYPWGSVAYHQLPYRMSLPEVTRLYSPNMLKAAFGWNSDLPEWDGIVCRVDNGREASVGEIRRPIALAWSNVADAAVKKRAWSPLDLFGDAMGQIPPGEFGIIYLAYHEGAREEIANRRIQNFLDRMPEWEHSASIRVPISFLVRLYPRPLDHGSPDLIESTLRLCSDIYGEPALFEDFPNTIFTRAPQKVN
ncbi:hypothetical protein FRZ44_07150 [Hypericibacter terrae]|uniref:Uncharacterized protein n=1 Tax=Hypericibacter terrae TaxID=2602015 RepID=A0A5J6ME65_9PROT|nr:hypothetical protein [Hypericibacter terrae]QEX15431.1 hypothetical protein FRZ44_07150 [Hypericibacter terrae]